MNKKIIFLDIDGTLTMPGSNVPPESALEAIRGAQANGHLVFLCTGRNYDMLSPLLIFGFDGVIASSGAYIRFGDRVLYDCPMTKEEQNRIMQVLSEYSIFKTIECLDGAFTDEGFKDFLEKNAQEGNNSELLRWRKQIESDLNIQPMADYGGQPIYKVIVMSDNMDDVRAAHEQLKNEFFFCIQDMDRFGIVNGEIIKKEYDKGIGVERVCRELGIPVEDTIAFGDSMNDLEMIETAGLSICMENGSETIKQRADEICPSVEDDGIYRAFQKHHLI